jgi:hypothetical protein
MRLAGARTLHVHDLDHLARHPIQIEATARLAEHRVPAVEQRPREREDLLLE